MDDISSLLPLLSQFMHLKKLDLSENSLDFLPDNMSCLSKLEELNINGNMFTDTLRTIDCVATLPRLRALFINLNEEDQVDYIMNQVGRIEKYCIAARPGVPQWAHGGEGRRRGGRRR